MMQESPPPPTVAPVIDSPELVDKLLETGWCTLKTTATRCRKTVSPADTQVTSWDHTRPRYAQILETGDPKLIWKSINWKGTFDNTIESEPSDNVFKDHFENLLNKDDIGIPENQDIETALYMPVLDDPFIYSELKDAINSLNQNKGYSGICPGLLKVFPFAWLSFLLSLFNLIFSQSFYPIKWCYNRLFVLFKSGNRSLCDNYRGISIMDTMAKLYDTMIMNRILLWCNIDKCQAGAQKGRSCVEQIFTLRMLCHYAVYKKVKLYVLFIDFSKAYDRVSRRKLIEVLRSRGCGNVMLKAIQAMYKCTKNILKSAIISANIGVRQGSPSSCLLFVIYIDEMVRMIKNAVSEDGFLGGLHALLLMDDTVIVSSSRANCEAKLKAAIDYCNEYGMGINVKKTKFFVINGTSFDKNPLIVEGTKISYSPNYLYLGAWFTDSGKISDVLALTEKSNQATVNKFAIFCVANSQMPFVYKKLVFDAAVTASLLYSSESWLSNNIRAIESQYNQLVRCLLGVRKNTSVNLCLLESGIPPIQNVLAKKRCKFIQSKLETNDPEHPFTVALKLLSDNNIPVYHAILKFSQYNINVNPFFYLKNTINERAPNATKFNTYISDLNPSLDIHPVYTTNVFIPDYQRISLSRIRLMSHNLKIETGRWSRIPRERRVCQCDGSQLQTEAHVLIYCPLTDSIRHRYPELNFSNINILLTDVNHLKLLCKYAYEILEFFG